MKRKASETLKSENLPPPNKRQKSNERKKNCLTYLKSNPSNDEGLHVQEIASNHVHESGQLGEASEVVRISNGNDVIAENSAINEEVQEQCSSIKYKCQWPEPTLPSSYNYLVARSKDHRKLLLYTLYTKYPDISKAENIRTLMKILGYEGGRGSKVYNSIEMYFKRFKRYGLKYRAFSSFHRLVSQDHVLYEYDFCANEILRS